MAMVVQFSAKKHAASFLKMTQQAQGSGVCAYVVFAMSMAIHKKEFPSSHVRAKTHDFEGLVLPPPKKNAGAF
jgi:hypothetical protein